MINIVMGGRGYGKAYSIMKRYEEATNIFNIRNDGKYKITVFLDLNFLQITMHDLANNKYYPVRVLNNLIYDGEVGELVDAFEELRDSIDEETGNIIIKVKGDSNE